VDLNLVICVNLSVEMGFALWRSQVIPAAKVQDLSRDTIEDFDASEGDKIHIDASVFGISSLSEVSVLGGDNGYQKLFIDGDEVADLNTAINVQTDVVLF
jgi:hypothetical protein